METLEVPVNLSIVGQNSLLFTGGGKTEVIPFPVRPFKLVSMNSNYAGTERVQLIGGGEAFIGKEEFAVIPVSSSSGKRAARPLVDYVLELVKEHPKEVRNLVPQVIAPYPLFLDIETTSTELHFSKAERDQILSVQLKYRDSPGVIFLNDKLTPQCEVDMLMQALAYIKLSPSDNMADFIVGYFINRFDIPYLKTRIKVNSRYAPELWEAYQDLSRAPKDSRGLRLPISYPNWMFGGRTDDEEVDFVPGLLNLDLFVHAKVDPTLATLPSRGLKAAAAAYGAAVSDLTVEEKRDMGALLKRDPDRFMAYANGDITITEHLYNIYETRLVAAANLLTCPLMLIHRMTSGQKSYVALYRECRASGYFSLKKNEERYNHLYGEAEKYQGALVACYRKGYFPNTIYLDCKSMYPNIMHDFNVSYDRYTLDDLIHYEKWDTIKHPDDACSQKPLVSSVYDPPSIVSFGPPHKRTVYVPDDNYKLVLKYTFDFTTDGFVRRMINYYNGVRDAFKKKSKEFLTKYRETNDEKYKYEYMIYDSAQAEAKVINNTFYGIQGNRYYDMADLPAAIFVTSMGRWLMTEMVKLFGKKAIIELDTDGLLLDKQHFNMSIDDINASLRRRISEFFGIPESSMNFLLEFEDEGSVYMYKRKNYILRKNSDPTTLYPKGSSFKGYDKAKILHRAVRILSDAVMFHAQDGSTYLKSLAEARDIHGVYSREGKEPFKFSKTLKKNLNDYKGYKNAEAAIFNINIDPSQLRLKQLKASAIQWISGVYSGDDPKIKKRKAELCSSIRGCKNEDQLRAVAKFLAGNQSEEDRTKRIYYVMDMIERLQKSGKQVEIDDTIEYYYTMTKEQYTLESEMTIDTKLNFRKYQDEIENIIDRFTYADPRRISLSFEDLMEEDDEEEISVVILDEEEEEENV